MILKRLLIILFVFYSGFKLLPARQVTADSVFNAAFRNDIGGWIAGDATYSILLPDGRTLWLFGDTFIGEATPEGTIVPGAEFINNSAVLQEGDSLRTLTGGTISDPSSFLLTPDPDSTWYWPEHGIVDDDTLRIFVAKFRKDPDGPPGFQFAWAGNDICNLSWPGLEFINSFPIPSYPVNDVVYGCRILHHEGYIYIYGRKEEDKEFHIPYPHLARTTPGNISGSWEYYDGSGWSPDPADSYKINSFQVSQQYGVFKSRDRFVLLTQDIWFSAKIWSFVSDSPTGPWENKTLLYETPRPFEGQSTYNAYPHPQFDSRDHLLVSYNSNGDFWDIFSNVELYRPVFIRVPYGLIHGDISTAGEPVLPYRERMSVSQNYPNPFTDETIILYSLTERAAVSIILYDARGTGIRSYVNEMLGPGDHTLRIQGKDLEPGVYFYRLNGTVGETKILIRQ